MNDAAEAVAKVFNARRDKLVRFAAYLTRTARGVDPEDVAHQAYCKAVSAYRPGSTFPAVYTLLGHACKSAAMDAIRKERKYTEKYVAGKVLGLQPKHGRTVNLSFEDQLPDDRDLIGEQEAQAVLMDLEDKMPENYRGIITLDICGYSQEEGAELVGISKSAYKSRLYRARALAQKMLGDANQYESFQRLMYRTAR